MKGWNFVSNGTASTVTDKETSLSIEDINKAWDLVKDIPRLPFDEVWMHPKAKLPEFVEVREIGEGDEKFVMRTISGIPVLLFDSMPKDKMYCWKKGSILKGELPSLVMIVNLAEPA